MYTPSVLDQPIDMPVRRATCPIIRAVVVLPLVPVIATTLMCGRIRRGPEPSVASAITAPSALIISVSAAGPVATLSNTRARPYAKASAQPVLRHGYATTTSFTACPFRVRTANLVALPARANRRHDLDHDPYRVTLPEYDVRRPRMRLAQAELRAQITSHCPGSPSNLVKSSVTFAAGRGKYRFGPSMRRNSISERELGASAIAAQAPVECRPPST
jgi:hypothetical protein